MPSQNAIPLISIAQAGELLGTKRYLPRPQVEAIRAARCSGDPSAASIPGNGR
jgi:hypothetical protein